MNPNRARDSNPFGLETNDFVYCETDNYNKKASGLTGQIGDTATDICELFVPDRRADKRQRYVVRFRDLVPRDGVGNKAFKSLLRKKHL